MKIAGTILIIFGSLLLLLSLSAMLWGSSSPTPQFESTVDKVSFYIGYNILNILGIILIVTGIVLRRKAIRRRTKKDLINSLPDNQAK